MKKIKPLLFVCGGLMGIATLYGAIDLATSNSSGKLAGLYAEEQHHEQKAQLKDVVPVISEKEIGDEKEVVEKKVDTQNEKHTKQSKKQTFKHTQKKEETKELEWESFSRKPINMKFKKETTVTADTSPSNQKL
ncbi:MAG TPA: hypothetical protein VF622_05825 [Segetibacter sp.]|jgi:ribosomal protein L21